MKFLCRLSLIPSPTGIHIAKHFADTKLNNSLSKRLQWIQSIFLCYVWYGWYPPERCVLKHHFSSGAPVAWMESRTFLAVPQAFHRMSWRATVDHCYLLTSRLVLLPSFYPYPSYLPISFPPRLPILTPLLSISSSHVLWMLCLHSGLQRFKAWTETPTFDWCVSSFELSKLVFTHVLICVYVFRHVLVCMC